MRSNSMSRTIALAVMALVAFTVSAVNVTGFVKDSNGEPMIAASLTLRTAADSAYVAGGTTADDGSFTFKRIKKGRYVLNVEYVGYDRAMRAFSVTADSSKVDLGTITIYEKSQMLGEVVVKGVKSEIKVMQDTIEYNADSYKVQPNAVVEDLLKRLPGVEVGSDGKITANGKEIKKILVDGKEFFSDDPAVASKNLPASMIEKLQVVDRQSDLARITGVSDGEEETVINLSVKPGMKNGWFGTVEAGYGTDKRYAGSFNINHFWNDNQITFIGNANNINSMGFNDGNRGRFRGFFGMNGINTVQSLGVNFNVGNKEIFRVGGNVFYSHSNRESITDQNRQYLFADSVSFSDIAKRSVDKSHMVRGDFRLQWNPDENNTFEFRPRFSVNLNNSTSSEDTDIFAGTPSLERGDKVSTTSNRDESRGNSYSLGGQLIYNHKFASRPGRSFSVDARYELSNVREKQYSLSMMQFFKLDDQDDSYYQFTDNHTWNNMLQGRVSWTEPLGDSKRGNFLTFAYRAQYRWNNADKLVYDYPYEFTGFDPAIGIVQPWEVVGELPEANTDLSNEFRNNYFNQDIRLGYKRVKESYNIEVGMSLVPQMSRSINLTNPDKTIPERWVWNVAPFLRYRLKMTDRRSLSAFYHGRSSQPSMAQLQPVADYSDPMKVVQGNPELNPSFTHNVNIRFQDFDLESQRSIMAMVFANMTQNSIVSRTEFKPETGAQFTTYENVNGVWNAFGMAMFSRPLPNKAFQFTNNIHFNVNRNVGFNNNERNVSNNLLVGESFSFSFRPDNLEFELRPYYNLQKTWNTLRSANNTLVHTYGGTFNATYYTPIGIVLNTDLTYTATSGYTAGYNRNEWMWNAQISYQFLRDKSATISLRAYDLLAQKSDISRTITANYIDDTRFNALTRYFMLSFTYKFNTFGKGNEPSSRGGFGPGGMMGPPPGGGRPRF